MCGTADRGVKRALGATAARRASSSGYGQGTFAARYFAISHCGKMRWIAGACAISTGRSTRRGVVRTGMPGDMTTHTLQANHHERRSLRKLAARSPCNILDEQEQMQRVGRRSDKVEVLVEPPCGLILRMHHDRPYPGNVRCLHRPTHGIL